MRTALLSIVAVLGMSMPACVRQQDFVVGENHPAHPNAPTAAVVLADSAPRDIAIPAQPAHAHAHEHSEPPAAAPNPQQAQERAPEVKGASQHAFACPMHPEVTGSSSEERCPKCGMRLRPVPKAEDDQ